MYFQCYKDSECFVYETFEDDTAFNAKQGFEYFRCQGASLKRQRDLAGSFHQEYKLHMKSHLKLTSKKTNTIGETLVKPVC